MPWTSRRLSGDAVGAVVDGVGGEVHERLFEGARRLVSSDSAMPASAARRPISVLSMPVTESASSASPETVTPSRVSSERIRWLSSERRHPAALARRPIVSSSAAVTSVITLPRPTMTKWSAVGAISLIRCEDRKTVRPSAASRRNKGAHPHAFGVQAVDRLVEHHGVWVTQERGSDAQALAHAQREAPDTLTSDLLPDRPAR